MSEADKMFQELGYKKITNNFLNYVEYTKKENEDVDLVISFNGESKTVMAAIYEKGKPRSRSLAIIMKELEAINKKVEELKWN